MRAAAKSPSSTSTSSSLGDVIDRSDGATKLVQVVDDRGALQFSQNLATGEKRLVAGTFNRIVDWCLLQSDECVGENSDIRAFFLAYRTLKAPEQMLRLLQSAFEDWLLRSRSATLRTRLFWFLLEWVEQWSVADLWQNGLFRQLLRFADTVLDRALSNHFKLHFVRLQTWTATSVDSILAPSPDVSLAAKPDDEVATADASNGDGDGSGDDGSAHNNDVDNNESSDDSNDVFSIDSLKPSVLAEQLTLVEASLFAHLKPLELLYKVAPPPDKRANSTESLTPTLNALAHRFNTVSYWVATEVVMAASPKQQAARWKLFARVAKRLRELNNFNTLMQVITGLGNAAVARLKRAKEHVRPKYLDLIAEYEQLFAPLQHFASLRAAMSAVAADPTRPMIPYLAMYLRDMQFIKDGNPTTIADGAHELVNFDKMRMFAERIDTLHLYTRNPYLEMLAVEPAVRNGLLSVKPLSEQNLYNHSRLMNPIIVDSEFDNNDDDASDVALPTQLPPLLSPTAPLVALRSRARRQSPRASPRGTRRSRTLPAADTIADSLLGAAASSSSASSSSPAASSSGLGRSKSPRARKSSTLDSTLRVSQNPLYGKKL
jgi:RasGEF domain